MTGINLVLVVGGVGLPWSTSGGMPVLDPKSPQPQVWQQLEQEGRRQKQS